MRKIMRALSNFGIGITIWPLQWWPLWRWQRYGDKWGQMVVITIGPLDIQISTDWGPLGPPRGGLR